MSNSDLVRYSRDGDQFHYLWAARRCLKLLEETSGLIAISIEGPSPNEAPDGESIEAGEEIVDVGEYYGSERIKDAEKVRHIQLKHSTTKDAEAWTLSGLKKTIVKFAERFIEYKALMPLSVLSEKLSFSFTTNRPISLDVILTFQECADQENISHPNVLNKIKKYTSLDGESLCVFCGLISLDGDEGGYWEQRNLLADDVSGYLPGHDSDIPVQLKELVTKKALSESAAKPTITKQDVLQALKTDVDQLFPASNQISRPTRIVPRVCFDNIAQKILDHQGAHILVHAEGGVGKTFFTSQFPNYLPEGSLCLTYDCFGNGQYRSASKYRHRHKDALVQMANELAQKGLCHPLIPVFSADPAAYIKAFIHRLNQGILFLRANNSRAQLCLLIDAADNAQQAAQEAGDNRAFILDLLREDLPAGVKLVVFCRTHRKLILKPLPSTLAIEIPLFSLEETASHVLGYHPQATEQQIKEFHQKSSGNPRVQDWALAAEKEITNALVKLGPTGQTVSDTLANMLAEAVWRIKDSTAGVEAEQIEELCAALAILPPLIPISLLTILTGLEEAAIRSFATDIGRPLAVLDNHLHFYDEPAENWFKETHEPTGRQLEKFIEKIKSATVTNVYAASIFPLMLYKAGQLAELTQLALSKEALPDSKPFETQEIALARLHFALRACLRQKRYADAAELAFRAGGISAGSKRLYELFHTHTDLAALALDAETIQAIVYQNKFQPTWKGSNHIYNAGIMSVRRELQNDALSSLRVANEWLQHRAKSSQEGKDQENISMEDVAELAWIQFNLNGSEACANELRRWKPRRVSYSAGRLLVKRLLSHDRIDKVQTLSRAAGNNFPLVLAVAVELTSIGKQLPLSVLKRTWRIIVNRRISLKGPRHFHENQDLLELIVAIVTCYQRAKLASKGELLALINQYFSGPFSYDPASPVSSWRAPVLQLLAIKAALSDTPLTIGFVLPKRLQESQNDEAQSHSYKDEKRRVKDALAASLPWYEFWAKSSLGLLSSFDFAGALNSTLKDSKAQLHRQYGESLKSSQNEIVRLWTQVVAINGATNSEHVSQLKEWIDGVAPDLFSSTFTEVAQLSAHVASLHELATYSIQKAYVMYSKEQVEAEEQIRLLVDLARAILPLNQEEGLAYFNKAMEIAERTGEENLNRWDATLDLADRACSSQDSSPELAYRLARAAEATYSYVDRDKHFPWKATVNAITLLCPRSIWAILSRWRDRNFGFQGRLLPYVVSSFWAKKTIPSSVLGCLLPFQAWWDYPLLFKSIIEEQSPLDKKLLCNYLSQYTRYSEIGAEGLQRLNDLYANNELDTKEIKIALKNLPSKQESYGGKRAEKEISSSEEHLEFIGRLELVSPNDIEEGYRRFCSLDNLERGCFFKSLFRNIPTGKEAQSIKALANCPKLIKPYMMQNILEAIPSKWLRLLSVPSALQELLVNCCRQYALTININRYYPDFPFTETSQLTGKNKEYFLHIILEGYALHTGTLSASKLFATIGILAPLLSIDEARNTLRTSLDYFEVFSDDDLADGFWSPALEPPSDIYRSIAGYIWGGLASPEAKIRWESAHSVRSVCLFNQVEILDKLMELAFGGVNHRPFADSKLHFYQYNALLWFLIAIARVSKEKPELVAPYAQHIENTALTEEHILIRTCAANIALNMLQRNVCADELNSPAVFKAINDSPFPIQTSASHTSLPRKELEVPARAGTTTLFGMDFGSYWLEPLGNLFRLPRNQIEPYVERIIRDEWGFPTSALYEVDNRNYGGNRPHLYKSDRPRVDNLEFYLSYHATFVAASRLVKLVPLHRNADRLDDDLEAWIKRHLLTRNDGLWISDRRDQPPLLPFPNNDSILNENWCDSVDQNTLWQSLTASEEQLRLWGDWSVYLGDKEERGSIQTALVSSDKSDSLLRALKSTIDPNDFRIPAFEDSLEINSAGFRLKGWVQNGYVEKGLDEYDPWADNIDFPPLVPASYVTDGLGLSAKEDDRFWCKSNQENSSPKLWSYTWGVVDRDQRVLKGKSGQLLVGSLSFVNDLLKHMDMDLIVKVKIERTFSYSSYFYKNEKYSSKREFPTFGIFLIKANGDVYS